MLHDELGGVGFVFAVVDVHLELVGLEGEKQVEMRGKLFVYGNIFRFKSKRQMWISKRAVPM